MCSDRFLERQIDPVVFLFSSVLVITAWIWNVLVSPTILLRPSSLRFFTLHPPLAVSEFTFVAEVWPLQHRRVPLWGGLIQTFQPNCFNEHKAKKKKGGGGAKNRRSKKQNSHNNKVLSSSNLLSDKYGARDTLNFHYVALFSSKRRWRTIECTHAARLHS